MQPLDTHSLSTVKTGIHRACRNQTWTPRDESNFSSRLSCLITVYTALPSIIRVSEVHKGINERNKKEISREIESNRKKIGEGSNFLRK